MPLLMALSHNYTKDYKILQVHLRVSPCADTGT